MSNPVAVWDERLVPVGRVRQARNLKRNQARWAKRWRRWQRQQPRASRASRRRRRLDLVHPLLRPSPGRAAPGGGPDRSPVKPREPAVGREPSLSPPDPLADLRQQRGWIDQMSERELWALLIRVRWPHGPACPCCQEQDPTYVELLDPDYRDGLGRWRCRVCAEAGDAGEGGTFTPLTGTLLEGNRLDARSLWLLVELFADNQASVEARVNRHTADRLFRLLRAAIYHTRSQEPLVLTPEQVFEERHIRVGEYFVGVLHRCLPIISIKLFPCFKHR